MPSHALLYAGAGIPVFPVKPDKTPYTANGFHDATTDRETIERWWTEHPRAGIATPAFDVVDVDLYKPQCQPTWDQIKPLIPEGTPCTRTGQGGLQYIFAAGTLKDGKIGPGVDSRYAGRNYVLLPPSVSTHGGYEAVVSVMQRRPRPAPSFPSVNGSDGGEFRHLLDQMAAGEKIVDGRNKATWWQAVQILRVLPPGTDLAPVRALVQSWVDANCAGDLTEIDVPKQVRGAAKYVMQKRVETPDHPRGDNAGREIGWHQLADVEMRSIVFVDKPLLQADAFHLLVGRKGVGKGTVLADYAARVTRGELGEARNVIWVGSEDSAAIDIRPRLEAAEGDPARVTVVKHGWLRLPDDLDSIAEVIRDRPCGVGLLIIDPLSNHLGGRDGDRETQLREALAPLNTFADEHKLVLIGVRHLTEKEASAGALAAILGSSAWVQTPRAVLAIVCDNEDATVSHIQCIAGNRLPPDTPGRMLRIEGVTLDGLENEVTRCVWLGDSFKDVETLLATVKEPSKSAQARELILDTLKAADDLQMESDTLDALIAQQTGLTARTVGNLRGELREAGLVKPVPEKDEFGSVQRWLVMRTQAPRS
jgi:hypothetical protein